MDNHNDNDDFYTLIKNKQDKLRRVDTSNPPNLLFWGYCLAGLMIILLFLGIKFI